MSGSFAWVCICIPEGGHFSFLYAYVDPRMTRLALKEITNTKAVKHTQQNTHEKSLPPSTTKTKK